MQRKSHLIEAKLYHQLYEFCDAASRGSGDSGHYRQTLAGRKTEILKAWNPATAPNPQPPEFQFLTIRGLISATLTNTRWRLECSPLARLI